MALQMDYDRVEWLRTRTSDAAGGMDDASLELAAADVPADAFGNTTGGAGCGSVWQEVVTNAATARLHMGDAVSADVDRLAEVIACFQSTDHQSADEICAAADSLTVISAKLHSHFPDAPGNFVGSDRWNDFLRAGQHDRLVDYAAGREGPVVVGVDANVSIDRDYESGTLTEYDAGPLAPAAVERFGREGFVNGAADYSAVGVGTFSPGATDYIWARDLDIETPHRLDGASPGHAAQVVDYPISRW
jgi:hypothetical protein